MSRNHGVMMYWFTKRNTIHPVSDIAISGLMRWHCRRILSRRDKSTWSHGKRVLIISRHGSNFLADLSDIRGVSKRPPDRSAVTKVAHCEVSLPDNKIIWDEHRTNINGRRCMEPHNFHQSSLHKNLLKGSANKQPCIDPASLLHLL